jgi:hypothetical protein
MKYFFFILFSISAISCASHESREPSSVENQKDVSRGVNADFYGGSFR